MRPGSPPRASRAVLAGAALGTCLAAGLLVATPAAAGELAGDSFKTDSSRLCADPHRLVGSPEGRRAADYILKRLEKLGVKQRVVQPFVVPRMRITRCELRLKGADKPLRLYPMRPNGIVPPVTPPGGLSGPLVHVGNGQGRQLAKPELRGAIAVMDYNSGGAWLKAFRLGARAVVFVKNGRSRARSRHHTLANANFPRFYYPGARSNLPEGATATLHSKVLWERGVGRNIIGFLPGHDPDFGQDKEEVIVLAAHYDSFGEVPVLSRGARGAANCAGLLRLAAHFKKHQPRRHVVLLFLDGQARGHSGSRAFYRALESSEPKADVESRRKSSDAELAFVAEIEKLLDHASPFLQDSAVRRHLLGNLSTVARERAALVANAMYDLRIERLELKNSLRDVEGAPPPTTSARIEAIDSILEKELQPHKDQWNDVLRALGHTRASRSRDDTKGLSPQARKKLMEVMEECRSLLAARRNELLLEKRNIDADASIKKMLGDMLIVLHASLLLGDTTSTWGLAIGGDSSFASPEDNPGLYGKVQAVFLRACDALKSRNRPARHFLRASTDQSLSRTRVLFGAPFLVHSGEIAGLFGIYNLALATCQERLDLEGTPDDVLANLDLGRIRSQVDDIGRMLSIVAELETEDPDAKSAAARKTSGKGGDSPAVADQEGLSLRRGIIPHKAYRMRTFSGDKLSAPGVLGAVPGSPVPNRRVRGAIIKIDLKPVKGLTFIPQRPYAFEDYLVLRSDATGSYWFGPVVCQPWQYRRLLQAYGAAFDEHGRVASSSDSFTAQDGRVFYRVNAFHSRPGALVLPPQVDTTSRRGEAISLLSARTSVRLDQKKYFLEACDGAAAFYWHEREKGMKLFSLRRLVGLSNGPEILTSGGKRPAPEGTGFNEETDWHSVQSSNRSAADLWRLNQSRSQLLLSRQIRDRSLIELHARSEDLLLEAAAEKCPLRREALAACSFRASEPVYTKIRSVLDDLVFAILLLLALSVPFAWALERVVIGATTIYRQIGWFVAFFAGTFGLLYLSHPAFAISSTPIIIFLGFTIVVMSAMVIVIIMRKFEHELKALQGMAASAHALGVSRVSTFVAAMQMGISTMRRRPLRTTLTAVTVTLLTFTILCFASFSTQLGIVRIFVSANPSYHGVMLHRVNWQALAPGVRDMFRHRWDSDVEIHPRVWMSSRDEDHPGLLVTRPDGTNPIMLRGVLGLDSAEIRRRPDLAKLFSSDLEGKALLTRTVTDTLGLKEGDEVLIGGLRLRLGPPFDAVRSSVAVDMDGSSVLPVSFMEAGAQEMSNTAPGADAEDTEMNWTSLPPDSVVVVDPEIARRLGGELYALNAYAADTARAAEMAEDAARMLPFPVAATRGDGVYRHVLGTVLAASGARDLFFPILLGGLVVFGTMLASVADREREIYTFSALGLAPRHVGTLFFAEAMVYSLVGGMGGYLMAQGILKVLTVLSDFGWVRVPEMNMSSTNTIVTILIVMVTVLISAIYPGIRASRSANPGLMRGWRLPPAEGDRLEFVFPFTVSEYDITGVVSFLQEHFASRADSGLGRFMARDVSIVRAEDGHLGIDATVALAPFDLGVSQKFSLRSVPSEIPGIDEVRLVMNRRSGQPRDWQRLNKVFMDDLRQQFLLWRSMPQETMEVYRQRTLTELGRMKPAQPAAGTDALE